MQHRKRVLQAGSGALLFPHLVGATFLAQPQPETTSLSARRDVYDYDENGRLTGWQHFRNTGERAAFTPRATA